MDESNFMDGLPVKRLSLIDVSSEDDSLLFSRPTDPLDCQFTGDQEEGKSFELLKDMTDDKVEHVAGNLEQREQPPQLFHSLEPEQAENNSKHKYNLRKSLAWDSAFFTSAGFLDPEEITSMIGGVEKNKRNVLPVILEDIKKSSESVSTFESDSLISESLDENFFEDVRASIQKSAKTSIVESSGSKAISGGRESQNILSSGSHVDLKSYNKMGNLATKKPNVGMQGRGKVVKQGSARLHVSQQKELRKPVSSSTSLTKRASLGNSHVKDEKKENVKSTISQGSSRSRPLTLGSSKTIISGTKPPTAVLKEAASSSSSDTSGRRSSINMNKSPFNTAIKRKVDPRSGNPTSSESSHKTLSRVASRTETQSGNYHSSAHLISRTKQTSGASPASSISEWSSVLSSSSTIEQRTNSSRASLDTSSVTSETNEGLEMQDHPKSGEIQASRLLQQSIKKASAGSGLPPAFVKPSGLRLPSPKIGFFDGTKLTNTKDQPAAGEVGSSGSSRCLNKGKLVKLQPPRTITALRCTKPDSQRSSLNMNSKSPKPHLRKSSDTMKVSDASIRNGAGISPRIQRKTPPKMGKESPLKVEEVEAEGRGIALYPPDDHLQKNDQIRDMVDQEVRLEIKDSALNKDVEVAETKGQPSENDFHDLSDIENTRPSQKVTQDKISGPHIQKNDLHLINNINATSETPEDDQFDGLSTQVGEMDINIKT